MGIDVNRVRKPARKLRKRLKKMPDDPSPRQVHSFRTNARKMEATIKAIELGPDGKKTVKSLSGLRKRAGRVRDMDVLTAYVMNLKHLPQEEECSVRLLEHLGAVRQKQVEKFCESAERGGTRLRKSLKRVSKLLEQVVSQNQGSGLQRPSTEAASSAVEVLSEIAEPKQLSRSNLHRYRIKVKQLRNLLRIADDGDSHGFIERLGEVKDAIGEWHDWEELVAMAREILDHPRCGLIAQLKQKANRHFDYALGLTKNMRKQFLGMKGARGSSKRRVQAAAPAWNTAVKLAA